MKIGMMADIYKALVSGVTHSVTFSKQWLGKEQEEKAWPCQKRLRNKLSRFIYRFQ